ncbi:MAG: hypothetical protein CVV52_03775 [Spirochaetae bacterium HGW-Spirochaetae-8]|jgi:hypothetical protein|nr:MAG: hypothetical protein CVV52_03775 [Spirochaetae bacterium HGW-Spirochaetae-8]
MMMKRILLLLVLIVAGFSLFAADVTVVYLDRSETNLEASNYIKKQAISNKLSYKFIYTSKFSSLKGTEKAVVILNSGKSSGTDPRIASFLSTATNKQAIIVVNLYSVGKTILVDFITPVDSALGVDEISTASQWVDKGANANQVQAMHKQWTAELFRLIGIKQGL